MNSQASLHRQMRLDQAAERLANLPDRISDLVWQWAARTPHAPALIDGEHRWTYAELATSVRATADFLQELDIRPGDRVMLTSENGRAAIALLLAVSAIDAWSVVVNARLSGREIDAIAAHCGARRIIFTVGVSAEAAAHAERHQASVVDVRALGQLGIGALNEDTLPEPLDTSSTAQVAALIYTSGTTGAPKGVMLTHRNLLFIAAISGGVRGFVADDVIYGALPLSHALGLSAIFLGALYAGACYQPCRRFSPDQTLCDIAGGVTALPGAPAMYAKLLAHIRESGTTLDTRRLRQTSAGGSPLDAALKSGVESLTGLPLQNGYGMTEATCTIAMTRHGNPAEDSSVGPPLPFVDIRIVDGNGQDLRGGEVGHVWCRGPGVMKGYYKAPDLTAETITPDGWLITGDLGSVDDKGNLHISGRSKELIIRSGFNVHPAEVEAVLNSHPKVIQAAVIGAPGAYGNEEVIAYLQVAPGDGPTNEELSAYCSARLARYKCPSRFERFASLPAGPTGKIQKHRLAEVAKLEADSIHEVIPADIDDQPGGEFAA